MCKLVWGTTSCYSTRTVQHSYRYNSSHERTWYFEVHVLARYSWYWCSTITLNTSSLSTDTRSYSAFRSKYNILFSASKSSSNPSIMTPNAIKTPHIYSSKYIIKYIDSYSAFKTALIPTVLKVAFFVYSVDRAESKIALRLTPIWSIVPVRSTLDLFVLKLNKILPRVPKFSDPVDPKISN